ncbi:replicative DNA helicase loader DnaI [Pelagirhabdus alkalitolerans]|uniref:Replicative DNA helicase loader DnaI n=1 Tax=Pelagirhabdus alkalitolerans TaxID=1612202 RepID=A0A1G6HKV2_9BACI|nr:primosomal protein DnaI [Pelagirhabdus alkalitolerans]SDB94793.1 replicative DNA helicase loader DnaI [Pelagirhabdus alkalitolerans]
MESIRASLKKWMNERQSFQEAYQQMREELLNDPDIQSVIQAHPKLDQKAVDRQLIKLYEYYSQNKDCSNCSERGGGCAENILPGYKPVLEVEGTTIHLSYVKCKYTEIKEQQMKRTNLIKSLYMPKEILEASISTIDAADPDRHNAIKTIVNYLKSIHDEIPKKGFYIHGPFGVGKTYFLGAIANEFADKNIESMLIYMPELVREIKGSFKDDSVGEKIDRFKKVQALMIDDIGAESLSSWFRDEVLGSILQYRMMEGLPTFFTSNYSLDQLEHHLSTTTKGDVEQLKAGRIIERIQQVSEPIEINAANRR